MARIAGVDLPPNKQVWVGLTYIHGIGVSRAKKILAESDVEATVKVKDLTEDEARRIRKVIQDEGRVEGDLRKEVVQNIRRLMEIGCYRGCAPPPQPAGPRPEDPHQRSHPQGAEAGDGRRQEEGQEVTIEVVRNGERSQRQKIGPEERQARGAPGAGFHQGDVQQHTGLDHRPRRERDRVGIGRQGRFQGLAQRDAIRGPDGRPGKRA